MHWILQNNIFDEQGFDELVSILIKREIPYSIHKIIPFVGDITPDINPEGCVICIGAYSLRKLAKTRNWYPGVFDLEPFDFTEQLKYWGDRMLNHDAVVSTMGEAIIGPKPTDTAFIRPIHDSKSFAGMLITQQSLNDWQKDLANMGEYGYEFDSHTLVQVCSLKHIVAEYRFWVVNGQIITKSLYKRGSVVIYSNHVDQVFCDFVQQCIDIWQPLPAFVIDVCELANKQLKIVEINTINSSGFYKADMDKLVSAFQQFE